MIATIMQIAGLTGITVAGAIEYGFAGGIAGASIALVYVGLAMEGDT
jgi:hypothetical protein